VTEGVAAVLDRIQDIQSRIAAVNTAGRPVVTSTSGSSSTDGFATTLATELGQTDAASTYTAPASSGATDAAGTTGSAAATGQRVVDDATRYLGVPYVWGGTDPDKGLDCSGLVQRVFADLGIKLPRVSGDQARAGTAVPSVARARPGDIVAFGRPVDHVGIYVGDGKMIAAPYPGKNVRVEPLPSTPVAIRRIVGDTPQTFTAPGSTPYARLFATASSRHHLPDGLLAAVAKAESGFDPSAVSPAGAQGLMQLMPATARGLGVDPRDPAQAIDGAARLLARNLRDFGSVPLALAAYNAGPAAVRKYGGVPPYTETQTYVARVQAYQKELS
jgi:cell wall-associated NlpC family hydrolase